MKTEREGFASLWIGGNGLVGSIPTPPQKKPNKNITMDITGFIFLALVAIVAVAFKYSNRVRQFVDWLDSLEYKEEKK